MVLTEVQEHPDVEVLAIDPLHLIRLAGYLGGHIRQAVIPGLGKQPLQVQGLRRGQMGVHVRASAVASGGGAEAHGPARQGVGDGLDHIGGGGFPLGAGDADQGQLPVRVAEEISRHKGQGPAGVRNKDIGQPLHRVGGHGACRAPLPGLGRVIVAVGVGSVDGHEHLAGPYRV